ncbi:hypothetical protein EDC01DRAFT_31195 [Geopyxis carbonaria]|nr:hypothetical protein EDC01DRAFT_31195 [Geopyxis carbonaria]
MDLLIIRKERNESSCVCSCNCGFLCLIIIIYNNTSGHYFSSSRCHTLRNNTWVYQIRDWHGYPEEENVQKKKVDDEMKLLKHQENTVEIVQRAMCVCVCMRVYFNVLSIYNCNTPGTCPFYHQNLLFLLLIVFLRLLARAVGGRYLFVLPNLYYRLRRLQNG